MIQKSKTHQRSMSNKIGLFKFKNYLITIKLLYNFRTNTTNEINGHRIVDMSHIFVQIQNMKHDGGFNCNFLNMNFVCEIRSGLYSDFIFKCGMYNLEKKISSTKVLSNDKWSINKAAVNSTIAVGKYKQEIRMEKIVINKNNLLL